MTFSLPGKGSFALLRMTPFFPARPANEISKALEFLMAQKHTYDSLHRALKNGELAPVYYLYGAEDVLKDEAITAILDRALDPSFRDFNYDQRSIGQLDPEAIHSLLNTPPMMAERRVVVLREIEQLKRKAKVKSVLESYLQKPSPDTLLIMVQSSTEAKAEVALARGSIDIEIAPLPPERVIRWIHHYGKKYDLTLTPEAAEHLFEVVGNDLGMLRMELDKLASLTSEGPVGVEEIAAMVGVRRGETLIDWRDQILEGALAKALPITGSLLEQTGMSGVKMVSTLGSAMTGLGLARSLYDRGMRGGQLQQKVLNTLLSIRPFGIPDWKAESVKWARWAPGWPMDRVREALRALLEADRALKNARISDERGVITELILRITAHQWGEAA